MIFTGRNKPEFGDNDFLECEFCGYQTSVAKNTQHIPSMKCPQKDCGKRSEDTQS